ncbi:hypothetical protein J18TS1_37080 [Oceanobacillus oncorhynchi subsp. incaldanensis]|uniref:GrpB family protein n=1 Tax=Oceanobacillus oncorhynchi TaxID=545501 RepID=UPI001B138C4A|nr:GrpB family protein [Oceanobacillus oncorhynchi]GIO20608.1 hypothetical protein J18TS1_37080 [Oceanobacillus oncorhynchi subsp. incaldanensis]
MRKVEVTPYNNDWPLRYEEEANKLRRIFGSEIIEVYHIGSTPVDGLTAKPVIDIMPLLRNINRIDDFNTAMIDIGYEPKGENAGSLVAGISKRVETKEHTIFIFMR